MTSGSTQSIWGHTRCSNYLFITYEPERSHLIKETHFRSFYFNLILSVTTQSLWLMIDEDWNADWPPNQEPCLKAQLPFYHCFLVPLLLMPRFIFLSRVNRSWRNLNLTSNLEEVIHLCLARPSFKNLRMLNLKTASFYNSAGNHPYEGWKSQSDEVNSDMSSAKK